MWDFFCRNLSELFPLAKGLQGDDRKSTGVKRELLWYLPNRGAGRKAARDGRGTRFWFSLAEFAPTMLDWHCGTKVSRGIAFWDKHCFHLKLFVCRRAVTEGLGSSSQNKYKRHEKKIFSKLHLLWVSGSENWQNELITRKIIRRRIFKEKKTPENWIRWFGKPKITVLFI